MAIDLSEKGFEANIEASLIRIGYKKRILEGEASRLFKKYAIDVEKLFEFLEATQKKKLEILEKLYGEDYKIKVLEQICTSIKRNGLVYCLQHGVEDHGVMLQLIYSKPLITTNSMMNALYHQNIFTESRQVYYSDETDHSLDVVVFINGLPLVVMELKNPFTGQTIEHTIMQFKNAFDPKEQLFRFNERVVVYFAVDLDEVFMTTKLDKSETQFLPFNKGDNCGKGNSIVSDNYRTHYLWDEILQPDSLLDILLHFVFVKKDARLNSKGDAIDERQTLIFPRFHQLQAVRKIEADVQQKGAGHHYLIQHSAGGGKTISMSWLAYRLSKLRDHHNEGIFNSVIVMTDCQQLDKQLRDMVNQFEPTADMVKCLNKDFQQLDQALNDETRIVIASLKNLSFIKEKVSELKYQKYALIIDEDCLSQGEKALAVWKNALSDKSSENADEEENIEGTIEKMIETIIKNGKQDHASVFLFSATPKPEIFERFGTIGKDGKLHAFHEYSMQQAIEEGFILDVLNNYTTYKTFYKIATLDPHDIAQKTEIIIEHYRNFIRHKIGGRAKAIVTTASRLHAVRFKLAFDEYLKKIGYDDLKTVVAFPGTVKDGGNSYTESAMNGFREKELPAKFKSDDYQILIVYENHPTDFNEPLLHTMYVDKPLSGMKAVRTLSCLNRTYPGKNDTFVLDFVNDPQDIKDSFQPYYETPIFEEVIDLNILYDLLAELESYQVYTKEEVKAVHESELKRGFNQSTKLQAELNAWIDKGATRFKRNLSAEEKEAFQASVTKFIHTCDVVFQIAASACTDIELYKQYNYLSHLVHKLPPYQQS
ncbi:type I restriction endonuclease [Rummeliibacillus suwonensis]|uniref:type I restriction endonuclease n=1 Tax=Rummeliibacillus suwonensis TaxID=1306154 RepID=UPI0028A16C02|nr:type I restriction endonuclease [Rummeliibacillus suwonensis]